MARCRPASFGVRQFISLFLTSRSVGGTHGTMNINIRYGHMTMALLAQTVIHQFRERLGAPFATWDAKHLSSEVFRGLVGNLRVRENRLLVTYYNAPNREQLRAQYQGLPANFRAKGVDPHIPWLYGFELDFCFR